MCRRDSALHSAARQETGNRPPILGTLFAVNSGRMLRVTIRSHAGRTTIALEGRLAGPSVEHLRACWLQEIVSREPDSMRIDLADVAFVDAAGKSLLRSFHEQGADLTAAGLMTRAILDEIIRNRRLRDASSDSHDDG